MSATWIEEQPVAIGFQFGMLKKLNDETTGIIVIAEMITEMTAEMTTKVTAETAASVTNGMAVERTVGMTIRIDIRMKTEIVIDATTVIILATAVLIVISARIAGMTGTAVTTVRATSMTDIAVREITAPNTIATDIMILIIVQKMTTWTVPLKHSVRPCQKSKRRILKSKTGCISCYCPSH